MMMMMMIVK